MYYGVEQSTDQRNRNTVIRKFTTVEKAIAWKLKGSGDFTYNDPEAARNWHHTFRDVYELQGKIDKKDNVFKNYGTCTYPMDKNSQLALYLWQYGREIN